MYGMVRATSWRPMCWARDGSDMSRTVPSSSSHVAENCCGAGGRRDRVRPVEMSWSKLVGGEVKIQCSVPANTTASLRLYKHGSGDRILVDGQVSRAASSGNFLETTLGPGKHEIHYPA